MQTLIFDDFDEYAAAVRDVDHEVTLRNIVRPRWHIQHVDVRGIHIQKGDLGSGDIDIGQSTTDGYVLVLAAGRDARHCSANGVNLQASSLVILEPGCEFCVGSSTAHEWVGVFIPTGKLTVQSDRHAGKCRVVQSSTGPVQQYLALISRILHSTQVCPEIVASGALNDPMLRLQRLSSQWISGLVRVPPSRMGRPRVPRAEIIRRIKSRLESHENLPLSARELVRASGVSERTLRDVFQQYFRVSPRRYLQLRQLQQVRHALHAAEAESVQVSQILVHFGVWEFGRFARKYHELFGELPSETLRGRSQRHQEGSLALCSRANSLRLT